MSGHYKKRCLGQGLQNTVSFLNPNNVPKKGVTGSWQKGDQSEWL
jgi:hypothetical protein